MNDLKQRDIRTANDHLTGRDSPVADEVRAQTILVVDDDPGMRVLVGGLLRRSGFEVRLAADGAEMMEQVELGSVDLLLLDVMLPGASGFELCHAVRGGAWRDIPIIMISARGAEADQVAGLELGADDYIAKPFGHGELLARIRAVLRRPPLSGDARTSKAKLVRFAGWTIDLRRRELLAPSGATVTLSAAEFDLLSNLAEHPRQIVSRDRLLELSRFRLPGSSDRSIDVLVSRLRTKLGGDSGGELIRTVRGCGYIFDTEVERS